MSVLKLRLPEKHFWDGFWFDARFVCFSAHSSFTGSAKRSKPVKRFGTSRWYENPDADLIAVY